MLKKSTLISTLAFMLALSLPALSQSPKKYFKNKNYEQAYVEAAHKQNKKVKLKKKHVEVIQKSYEIIYKKHSEAIASPQTTWQESYNATIRMGNFRIRVKNPGILDELKNIFYDETVLDHLGVKFNAANLEDMSAGAKHEAAGDYDKALVKYQEIVARHEQAKAISTLKDRLVIMDLDDKIELMNQKIGDKYINEAKLLLEGNTEKGAYSAIDLIKKAGTYRPLSIAEEELLTLANLIIGNSWVAEAEKLIQTGTKKNARLAFELINRAKKLRTLTAEEERLLEKAEYLGMTRILLKVNGANPINDAQALSGHLNKKKSSRWVSFYYTEDDSQTMDLVMDVTENKPTVKVGELRKSVTQNSKSVDYWVEETDAAGVVKKVKKTRIAVAVVAVLSKTKTAQLDWSLVVKDPAIGKAVQSETRETKIEDTNEFVSLVSGDVLALPENIESDVDLDSQPFPSDGDMLNQVKQKYLDELMKAINNQDY